jgi:DNA-binding NarL/FixJ family response regulator
MMKNSYLALTTQRPEDDGRQHVAPAGRAHFGGNRSTYENREQARVHLTPREREVLTLLCAGLPNKLISRQLGITASTVKTHVASILQELRVAGRVQAVIYAYRYKLVDDKDDRLPSAARQAVSA